jgi:hypothetical protein
MHIYLKNASIYIHTHEYITITTTVIIYNNRIEF